MSVPNQNPLSTAGALVTVAAKRAAPPSRALSRRRANVAIHTIDRPTCEQLARTEWRRPESAFTVAADMLDIASVEQMARDVLDRIGSNELDVLVNNASNFYPTPLGTVTPEQWHDLVGSNLKAPLFLSQALLPALRAARGVIVNIVECLAAADARYPSTVRKAGLAADAALARTSDRRSAHGYRRSDPLARRGMSGALRAALIKDRHRSAAASPRTSDTGCSWFAMRRHPGTIIAVDGAAAWMVDAAHSASAIHQRPALALAQHASNAKTLDRQGCASSGESSASGTRTNATGTSRAAQPPNRGDARTVEQQVQIQRANGRIGATATARPSIERKRVCTNDAALSDATPQIQIVGRGNADGELRYTREQRSVPNPARARAGSAQRACGMALLPAPTKD